MDLNFIQWKELLILPDGNGEGTGDDVEVDVVELDTVETRVWL